VTRSILLACLTALVFAAGAQAKDNTANEVGAILTTPVAATILPPLAAPLTPEPGVAGARTGNRSAPPSGKAPPPGVICSNCDGSGNVGPGCAVAGVRSASDGFSYDDTVTAYYHWCYHNGNVWDAYGWSTQDACQLLCERNGKDEHGFSFGYWVRGYWSVFSISKYVGITAHTSATACVAVDGWLNVWGC
jgi:hypothetical protein